MPLTNPKRRERAFVYYKGPKILWFRIFGYGLSITNPKHGFVPFSIRYGYGRYIFFLGHYFELLTPTKNK